MQEYSISFGGIGDFTYRLKAKLPEVDFPLYARNLGLDTHYDPKSHRDVPIFAGLSDAGEAIKNNWWNPPDSNASVYFAYEPNHEHIRFVKYANGFVYFVECQW